VNRYGGATASHHGRAVFSYTYPGGGGEVTVTAGDMRGMTDGGKTLLLKKQ